MPKITVWKCLRTGKLFEDEKVYRRHLKRLSRERIAAQKWQAVRDSVKDIISGAQYVHTVQELVDYIIKNQREFMIQGVFNGSHANNLMHEALEKGWDIYFPKLQSLQFVTNWRTEISNSHNCPRDGYTNWCGGTPGGVRSYPGWHGAVMSSYDKNDCYIKVKKKGAKTWKIIEAPSISDMVAPFDSDHPLSGVCTGSGWSSDMTCRYDVSLFQSDFPNMAKKVTFVILNGAGEDALQESGLRYEESVLEEMGKGEFKLEK